MTGSGPGWVQTSEADQRAHYVDCRLHVIRFRLVSIRIAAPVFVILTLAAAALSGCGFVLQQRAAEQAGSSEFLRLGLIARLVRNRGWLAGIGLVIAGDLIAAWSLGHLDLSVSEPLLTTSLIFALILAVPLSGQPLHRVEIAGAILLCAGVAALSLTRTVTAPSESFGSFSHWPAAGGIAVLAGVLVLAGRHRLAGVRATLTGLAAGLILGIADAFTRRAVQILDSGHPVRLLVHWPGYGTVVASLIGLWLMQNAFSAAPLHASLPAITAAEPAAGIILGVVVFGDKVHTGLWLILQAAGVAAMVTGVVLVARAPVLSELSLRKLPHTVATRVAHPATARTRPCRDRGSGRRPENLPAGPELSGLLVTARAGPALPRAESAWPVLVRRACRCREADRVARGRMVC
jgi:drug/metabolite transporter (DMT)-like permease